MWKEQREENQILGIDLEIVEMPLRAIKSARPALFKGIYKSGYHGGNCIYSINAEC